MIPKNIFQTHKSLDYIKKNTKLRNACNSWSKNTDYNYKFYNDKQCDNFIYDFFPEIKDVYDKLPLKVMKSDLWRYCIIYKYGGIYADADTVLLQNPSFLTNYCNKDIVIVPENNTHFCQWVFSAPANSPVLKSVIDLSVKRIRETKEFKGEHIIHYLTGPAVFTDGILNYLNLPLKKYSLLNYNYLDTHGKEGNILDFEDPYNLIKIGNSDMNTKIIELDKKLPSDTELTFIHKYGDTFSYNINDNTLSITRTDVDSGWGQDLIAYKFNTKYKSKIRVFTHSSFHKLWVKHLFSGKWKDGWCKQRDRLLT